MNTLGISRRRLCQAAALTSLSALARPGRPAVQSAGMLDLEDPEDALTAMVKMRGSLVAEDVPHWYAGTMYAVLPGRAPVPLVDFEGSEIDYYERQPDGSYHAHAATVSLFRDTETGKILDTFDNPITGERNEVRPNTISVNAYYVYSVKGFKRSDDPRPLPDMPGIHRQLKWLESGDHVWLTMRRPYPPAVPMGEHQLIRGSLQELHDPDLARVHTTGAPTYVSPWLDWLNMGDRPGHALWVGPARKLDSIAEYPRQLLDYLEKNFPEKTTARPAGR